MNGNKITMYSNGSVVGLVEQQLKARRHSCIIYIQPTCFYPQDPSKRILKVRTFFEGTHPALRLC